MENGVPGPIAILLGIAGICVGVLIAIIGAILQITFLRPAGVALSEQGQKLSFHSGSMIGKGFVETFRLIGRAFNAVSNQISKKKPSKIEDESQSQL